MWKSTQFTHSAAGSNSSVVNRGSPIHLRSTESSKDTVDPSRHRVKFGHVVERSLSVDNEPMSNATEGLRAAIRVRASERDRCVAPSMTKPKRRQTLAEGRIDGAVTSADGIRWTQESYNVVDIARMLGGKVPVVVRVTKVECRQVPENLSVGQNFLVQSSSMHPRVLCELIDTRVDSLTPEVTTDEKKVDNDNAVVSIPNDYQMSIYIEDIDTGLPRTTTATDVFQLSKAIQVKRFPFSARVDDNKSNAHLLKKHQRINLLGTHQALFLHASAVSNGWIDQSEVVMIPDCVGIKLAIAVGLILSTDQEWQDYQNMLSRCVRHLAENNTVIDWLRDPLLVPRTSLDEIHIDTSWHSETMQQYGTLDVFASDYTDLKFNDTMEKQISVEPNSDPSLKQLKPNDRNSCHRRPIHAYENVALSWSKKSSAGDDYDDLNDYSCTEMTGEMASAAIVNLDNCGTLRQSETMQQYGTFDVFASDYTDLKFNVDVFASDYTDLKFNDTMEKQISVEPNSDPSLKQLKPNDRNSCHRRPIHAYENVALSWSKKLSAGDDYDDLNDNSCTEMTGEMASAAIVNLNNCGTLRQSSNDDRRTSFDSGLAELHPRSTHGGETRATKSTSVLTVVDPDELGKLFEGAIVLDIDQEERRVNGSRSVDSSRTLHEVGAITTTSDSYQPLKLDASSSSSASPVENSETKSTDEGYDTKRNTMNEPIIENEVLGMLIVPVVLARDCSATSAHTNTSVTTESNSAFANRHRLPGVWPPPKPEISASSLSSVVTVGGVVPGSQCTRGQRSQKSTSSEQTVKTTTTAASTTVKPNNRPTNPPKKTAAIASELQSTNTTTVAASRTVKPNNRATNPPTKTAAIASELPSTSTSTPLSSAFVGSDPPSVSCLPENITSLSALELARCAVELLDMNQLDVNRMVDVGFDGRKLVSVTAEQLMKQFQMTPFNANKLIRFARGWRPTK